MHFCGPRVDPNGPKVPTHCLVDGLYLLPHMVLVSLALPNMICKYLKIRKQDRQLKNWVRYPGHNFRWILTLLLIFFQVGHLLEGVLSDTLYQGTHLHLYIPYAVGILTSVFSIVFYTFLEGNNLMKPLVILWVYWGVALAFRLLKLVTLFTAGLHGGQMRFCLVWVDVVIHLLLFLVDTMVLVKQVSSKFFCIYRGLSRVQGVRDTFLAAIAQGSYQDFSQHYI